MRISPAYAGLLVSAWLIGSVSYVLAQDQTGAVARLAPMGPDGRILPGEQAGANGEELFSTLAIQCPNPSIPFVSWYDTASVAPPPSSCHGWPREFRSTQGLIYYFQDGFGNTIGQNCDVRFKLVALDKSGFHCHSDPNRPVGQYDPKVGNTGPSGEEFGVLHEWPRASSILAGYFWSTEPGCPSLNDSTTIDFYYVIAGAAAYGPGFVEVVPGTGYTLKPPTMQHPDAYWGIEVFTQALQLTAADYATRLPGQTIGFNDMSLRWGGTFDLNSNWNPPSHCGHQVGNEIDIRSKLMTPDQQRVARFFLEKRRFVIKEEFTGQPREHWHLKYYGPGTYTGPGHALNQL